jgi:glutathione S-transferase
MKLFWSPRSPFVRKVMVCAHELDIAERIDTIYALVSLSKTNPEVMRVNPVGRIPALVTDDGALLYDSHVICEYLDAVHGGARLFRKDSPARWDTLRRLALGDAMLETGVLWRSELTRPPAQQSAAMLQTFEQKTRSALGALERDGFDRTSGDVDIGDIAIGCALGYLDFRYPDVHWREAAPAAAQWFERFNTRPSMQKTQPYEE